MKGIWAGVPAIKDIWNALPKTIKNKLWQAATYPTERNCCYLDGYIKGYANAGGLTDDQRHTLIIGVFGLDGNTALQNELIELYGQPEGD